jgi:predicted nucleic acid-binding protein
MILLDTNICIDIINAKPAAVLERFKHYRLGEIGLCSVVAAELAFGVGKSGSARNCQALEMFLAPLTILPGDGSRSHYSNTGGHPERIRKHHRIESMLSRGESSRAW